MHDREKTIQQLATKIVSGDFVPFIGAGCSRMLLGGNDWPGITRATANALGIPLSMNYTEIAQQYEERFGRRGLLAFLSEHLRIDKWNDANGYAHIALMELRFPFYYTTNVDNAIELCYATYSRPLDTVVEQSDLKKQRAGTVTLYKFHGDTEHADELVWTEIDYQRRISDESHFMHVLLRAHALSKSFLYIGYSLQDPHVIDLLRSMRRHYPDAMRESALIEYGRSTKLQEQAVALGIKVVCTADLYPDRTEAEAFDAFLADLGTAVKALDAGREMEMFFKHDGPGLPVLSAYDLEALEASLPTLTTLEAAKAFRMTCSWKNIPIGFGDRVLAIFQELCLNATALEAPELVSALFTMEARLPVEFYLQAYAAAFTLHRFSGVHIVLKHVKDIPFARCTVTAMAAILMREKGIPRNREFANWVVMAPGYGKEVLDLYDEKGRAEIATVFADIFEGSPRTNPLTRPAPPGLPGIQTFQSLLETMLRNMPHKPPGHGV